MSAPSRERLAKSFFLLGLVLLVLTLAVRWAPSNRSLKKPEPAPPHLSPTMVPLVTGEEPLDQLFIRAGCPVCHTIPGVSGADGKVGPKLVLGETGSSRLADPGYKGHATSVHEYVIESILNPSIYVVPGYPDRTMPSWYGQKLSAAAVDRIAAHLESLGGRAPLPRS